MSDESKLIALCCQCGRIRISQNGQGEKWIVPDIFFYHKIISGNRFTGSYCDTCYKDVFEEVSGKDK